MSSHAVSVVKKGVNIELVSVLWMVIEAAVAIGSGIIAHSLALVAFGADSIIELIAGAVLLWRLTIEARGASLARVNRAEKISSWVVGIALLLLAVYIVVASIDKLWTHQGAESTYVGIGLAIASGIIMPILSRLKKKIGVEIGSKALRADGACSIVCAYMAWTVLAGVVLTALFGWWWVDSIAALALVYFVVKEGWEAVQEARGKEGACGCCHDDCC
ncbi:MULTISPECIES: cation diffusion facilitator family transporter [Alicyclobacillus]|uniref:Cation efflux protein n=2 Tax=Alicyclobacillus acidocaldarius subsp. acidocaldarius TaxID=1388 RepID=C8WVN4_ALIAD|nr:MULTISPECIES: cation transporter [Alicyclobacillus]ACV58156.1 cation efflux protein [Alicyclobacillus acidocaldarius subsp. acidocaldarius DSM 446]AEJ43720.1 cation efflux protein [Alicyclobacillus acidocaldarius subsp. acidocaldarius Tc-4-1]